MSYGPRNQAMGAEHIHNLFKRPTKQIKLKVKKKVQKTKEKKRNEMKERRIIYII